MGRVIEQSQQQKPVVFLGIYNLAISQSSIVTQAQNLTVTPLTLFFSQMSLVQSRIFSRVGPKILLPLLRSIAMKLSQTKLGTGVLALPSLMEQLPLSMTILLRLSVCQAMVCIIFQGGKLIINESKLICQQQKIIQDSFIINKLMFLNLKNKKVLDIVNQQAAKANHPKTHRDDYQEHHSKEQKEIKSFRQYQNYNSKKIVGSTAVSTIQQNNSSFSISNNPHYANYIGGRHEQMGRNSMQSQNKSQQKLDSHRMQRVASAYKKIKKYDNIETSYILNEGQKSHERLKKLVNKGNKIIVKKQLLHNIANNYICATEADDNQSRIYEKLNENSRDSFQELLQPLLQLFSGESMPSSSRAKSKSHSSRDNDFNKSLQKNSKPLLKEKHKKSNQILIRDTQIHSNYEPEVNIHSFITNFNKRLEIQKQKIESKKQKNAEIVRSLFQEIQNFVFQIYAIFIKEIDSTMSGIEEKVRIAFKQQQQVRQSFGELQGKLLLQQKKSKILQGMVLNYQQKSIYSTIFFNQLSFNSDLDTFFRQKLYNEAKKNGLVTQFNQSQIDEGKLEIQSNNTQLLKKRQNQDSNIYDNSQNEFISFKIPFFNNCMQQQAGNKK